MGRMLARCLCGSIEAVITPPTVESAHCHCAYCRRAHGAAFVTWTVVPEKQFALSRGEERLRWYRSSEQSRRGFCERCGSSMLFVSKLAPGEVHVARALIEGDVDHEAALHCFSEQKVPWAPTDDELPEIDADNELLAHYKKISKP